jgi:hypothetical protein
MGQAKPDGPTPTSERATYLPLAVRGKTRNFELVSGGQLFYNDANGVMMVRGTPEDVATIKGVMEMLGAVPYPTSSSVELQQRLQHLYGGSQASGGFGASSGSPRTGGGGGGASGEPQGNQ